MMMKRRPPRSIQIQVNPTYKQIVGLKYLKDHTTQFVLFGGGAGGGKSWLGCEWLLMNCLNYPGTKWFIGRNELKRLMISTYITFQKVCQHHNLPRNMWKLDSKYNYIQFWNGSRIDLLDVAYQPSDSLYERFGSTEYTSGWLEEAGEIKSKAFEVLKSRIGRHLNDKYNLFPKIFLTCNPKKNWLYFDFYKKWKEDILPFNIKFIQSLYNDNPYTAKTYGAMLSQIKDKVLRERLRDGNWEYDDDDASMMSYRAILQIFENTQDPRIEEEFYLSVDPARFGRNKCVFILWQGLFIRRAWYYEKSSTPFIEKKIESACNQWHIPMRNVVVDDGNAGGGVVDHCPGVIAFVSAARPVEEWDDEKKYRQQETIRFNYKNLRAQCYDRLSSYVNEDLIGCYKDIPTEIRGWIIEELESIKRKDVANNESKFQIISKDEIKESLGRSPDFSDAIMERMVFELGNPRKTMANQESQGIDVAY